jgi:Ferritin-like domain
VSTTRRQLLRRGVAAGLAPAFALGAAPAARAAAATESQIVAAAVVLEQRAVLLYAAGRAGDFLEPGFARLVSRFEGQEREHVAVLQTVLEALGGAAPDPPGGVRGLAQARTRRRFAELAIEVESELVAGYQDALGTLSDPKLIQTIGSIMASSGQHLALLRQALGREPVPSAFETGR